ncbi:hypothetical protein [Nocardia salmonicida]|uniref:hypothetical protein n=1 Tax=Nocardia salmonicida TaxID=53431 RepID=UPI002E2905D2|nr:hypothetical protein [Nocardia salmonicida]
MFRRKPTEEVDLLLTAQLPDRIEAAHDRLAYQHDPALLAALSERELRDERSVAEAVREHDRHERLAQVASTQSIAGDMRRAQEVLIRAEADDLVTARRALAEQRRQGSAHAQVADLFRKKTWSERALAGVVIGAMLYSAVNVQHNLAPGGPSEPLYWASYLLEAFISTVLVAFMVNSASVARWRVTDSEATIRWIEGTLLAMSIGLNVYPYVGKGEVYNTVVHAVAPVMVGVALFAHTAIMRRYGLAIERAVDAADAAGDDIAERMSALTSTAHFAISTRTEASALGTPDPRTEVPAPRTSVADADEVLEVSADEVRTADADSMVDRTSAEPALASALVPAPHSAGAGSADPAPAESAAALAAVAVAVDTVEVPTASTDDGEVRVTDEHDHQVTAPAPAPKLPVRTSDDTVPNAQSEEPFAEMFARLRGDERTDASSEQPTLPSADADADDLAPAVSADPVRAARTSVPRPAPAVRTTTSARTTATGSADRVPALPTPVATALALNSSTSAGDASALWTALAEQVRAHNVGRRLPLDTVAQVLEMLAANATVNAVHSATKVHRNTIERIRDTGARVRAAADTTGEGGRVIELRKPQQ